MHYALNSQTAKVHWGANRGIPKKHFSTLRGENQKWCTSKGKPMLLNNETILTLLAPMTIVIIYRNKPQTTGVDRKKI